MKLGTRFLASVFKHPHRAVVVAHAWFMRRSRRSQIGIVVLVLVVITSLILFANSNTKAPTDALSPGVTLASVGALSGSGESTEVYGTVRSVMEATILSESGGAVRKVHTTLGAYVSAGFVIAEFENASERASVLSSEGAYEAALASRASLETDTTTAVQNAYRNAFIALDTTLENDVDLFFGSPTSDGPKLLVTADGTLYQTLPNMRRNLQTEINTWRKNLSVASTKTPDSLLKEAEGVVNNASILLVGLAKASGDRDSGVSTEQLAGLASARASVDGLLTTLSNVRNNYEEQKSGSATISASDAGVKQALGALRGAQANLEKTLVRSPISGSINFLPLRTGDYVTAFTHVATVAQNGALEITANVSEENRALLTIGDTVFVEDIHPAIITSISPALNPQTKQVEVRMTAEASGGLTNGASVRITLPALVPAGASSESGSLSLPLTTVKLEPDRRVIFSVDEESRLVAVPVETGLVRGSRIEILTPLDASLQIVKDARGHSDGEKVRVTPRAGE